MPIKRRTQEIRTTIMRQVDDLGTIAVTEIAKMFQITRQAVSKNVRELIASGTLEKTGSADHPYTI